ncbi:hypothetical protein [Leucobacter salsicius]|uniref:hypothetical protein n=1 Tax=Leucobacter salsicius TaxID=664638 RepID=UPI00036FD232|nr:hypothetical protein [Leucobacter salsicius]
MYINRQRQLPHEDWKDPRLVVQPPAVRHLATALRMMADPEGRGPVNLHLIRSNAFPSPDTTGWWPSLDDIENYMLMLDDAKWLTIYPNPDQSGPEPELFQVIARWPHVSREGESRLPAPPKPAPVSPSGRFPGSGERAGAGEWASGGERAGVSESERARLSGTYPSTSQASIPPGPVRLPPSSFCSVHLGGPPEQLNCRDCGTARLRHQRYAELRAARQQAAAQGGVLGSMAVQAIDTEMNALEAAAAAALMGAGPAEDPVEFIDAEGRVDHT